MENKCKDYKNKKKKHKFKDKVASVDLQEKRIVYLDGDIDDKLSKEIIEQLLKMDACSHQDITMYINSPGGSVTSGFAIYDIMNMIKSDVKTICIGRAASMACILLLNGANEKRFILPNAEIMIHEVSGGAFGKVSEVEHHLDHSKGLNIKLRKIIVDKTKLNWKQVKEGTTYKDKWFSAEEAKKYGFVDKVLY